jgi:hypothetical protein
MAIASCPYCLKILTREVGRDAVALQEEHNLLDRLLLGPRPLDQLDPLTGNPADLA